MVYENLWVFTVWSKLSLGPLGSYFFSKLESNLQARCMAARFPFKKCSCKDAYWIWPGIYSQLFLPLHARVYLKVWTWNSLEGYFWGLCKQAWSIRRTRYWLQVTKCTDKVSRTSARRTRRKEYGRQTLCHTWGPQPVCFRLVSPRPEVLEIHESNPSNLHRGWHHDCSSGHESALIPRFKDVGCWIERLVKYHRCRCQISEFHPAVGKHRSLVLR